MKTMTLTVIIALTAIFTVNYFYKNPAEKVAYEHVKANSAENIKFRLHKEFNDGKFAKYIVIPKENGYDRAQIYLKNNNGVWEAIAFGTAFPELETEYPELKGK